jgi:TRAP-type C4-dicarboxylate transport system permease small subunit
LVDAAGLLVLADIGVLLAGVIARFVLHQPLVWSDELASMLFIWLAMLGAVIALRRGEHMRMTALLSRAAPHRRPLFEALALCAALAFLAMVIGRPGNMPPRNSTSPPRRWRSPTSGARPRCPPASR